MPVLLLAAAGCYDQPVANGSFGSTTPRLERPAVDNSLLGEAVAPVRIGEGGANFAACNAQGEVRDRVADGPIPVRAAPFEPARQTGLLAPGTAFFICGRSHDQRWLGVVFPPAGRADAACGVSAPVTRPRDYSGPCESGWVASAQVRFVSGVRAPPVQANGSVAESH